MKTVLIIDDEEDIQLITAFRLKKAEYTVVSAGDGATGLAALRDGGADLVLLDISLPGKSGLEICREIKADPALRGIPVILFSASVENIEDHRRKAGAEAFLIKPFETENLLKTVAELLR